MSCPPLGAAALLADAGDDQSVASDAKMMLSAQLVAKLLQFFVFEFEQLVALGAVKVVVLRIAVVVLVDGAAVEHEFA